jgi:prevent-host-death family protein
MEPTLRRVYNMESVGAYEAKTHLPQLLDRVALGEEIQITRHGRPIARLVPEPVERKMEIRAVIAQIREFRKGRRLGDDVTIRELIDEGRRF